MSVPRVRPGDRLRADHQNQLIDTVNGLTSGNESIGSYLHSQNTASSVWVIPHGLPFDPSVEVQDLIGNLHFPLIIWSSGTVTLIFEESVAGTARLS